MEIGDPTASICPLDCLPSSPSSPMTILTTSRPFRPSISHLIGLPSWNLLVQEIHGS